MSASTITPPTGTPSRRTGRRIGYAVAIVVNLIVYGFINVWPGWAAFDFVTPAAADVVPIVNLSIGVTLVANVVYLFTDGTRVKALGDGASAAVAMVASFAVLEAFPFDFAASSFPWATLTRIILVIAVAGSAISVLANIVRFVRGPRRGRASV